MRFVFAGLFLASALFAAGFAIRLGPPWRNPEPAMTWLQSALAWVAVAFNTAWALAALAVHVPAWVFAVILLGEDAVFGWRWWVLEKARRRPVEPCGNTPNPRMFGNLPDGPRSCALPSGHEGMHASGRFQWGDPGPVQPEPCCCDDPDCRG